MEKQVILCVDDEKGILDNLQNLLLREFKDQYDIELAEDGEEALAVFEDYRAEGVAVPLVIADYIMPGMKGDDLLIELHKRDQKMMKILLTGQATIEGVVNAFEQAGLYRYIAKPWEKTDLLSSIREALKSYTRDRSLEALLEEKNRLLEKIKAAERKYRKIFEQAVEGIFQANVNGDFITVNPALEKLLGYAPDDINLYKTGFLKRELFCNPADWQQFISQLRQDKLVVDFITSCYRKGKEKIWVAIHARLFLNEKSGREIIDGYLQDITEKKKAREELDHYQKHLENLVEERTRDLSKSNAELQAALDEVKVLSGILPICASCKNIRNDAGYWEQVESYFRHHAEVEFSHGLCPECQKKLYGDQPWYKEPDDPEPR